MRGDSYFIGMRSLGQQGHIPEDGGLFLLCCIDRDWAVTQCFTEEAFQAITDFTDLPNSLFACNVHQSVFEGEESKVRRPSAHEIEGDATSALSTSVASLWLRFGSFWKCLLGAPLGMHSKSRKACSIISWHGRYAWQDYMRDSIESDLIACNSEVCPIAKEKWL